MQYSIVNYEKVKSFETIRLDAEYYKNEYLEIEDFINKNSKKFTTLKDLKLKIDGSAFYPALEPFYNKGDLPFLRVSDINNFIDYDRSINIPLEIANEFKTLKCVNKGDIVVTKGGSIARVGLIEKESAACRDLIFYDSSKLNEIDYTFLFVYFITDTYHNLLIRSSSMTAQPHLTLTLVKKIPIFKPSEEFKKIIFNIYKKSKENFDQSIMLYEKAEEKMLEILGVFPWDFKKNMFYIKKFSEVDKENRIDAEFHQPIYSELEKHLIDNYSAVGIGSIKFINVTTGQYVNEYVDKNEGVPYIRGTDLSNGTVLMDELVYIDFSQQIDSKIAKENDVVVTRVGTIGLSSRIPKECEGGTISDNLIRLRFNPEKINPYFLTLYLGSRLGKSFMIRYSRGSVQQRLNQETLKEVVLPIINKNIQDELAQFVKKSEVKRKNAYELLFISKKGVEIAIEKNEKEAMQWLNTKLAKV